MDDGNTPGISEHAKESLSSAQCNVAEHRKHFHTLCNWLLIKLLSIML
jgi:hypothetical protein